MHTNTLILTFIQCVSHDIVSYYNSANLCPSFRLSFDFLENRSHAALHARPMCCSEPDDLPFLFEFVQTWSNYTIKRLCMILHRQHCFPPFRRRCRTLLPYWRATQGGSKRWIFSETVDNRRTIVTLPYFCIIRCVYRVELILGRY